MPQIVELEGTEIEFPDDVTEALILDALPDIHQRILKGRELRAEQAQPEEKPDLAIRAANAFSLGLERMSETVNRTGAAAFETAEKLKVPLPGFGLFPGFWARQLRGAADVAARSARETEATMKLAGPVGPAEEFAMQVVSAVPQLIPTVAAAPAGLAATVVAAAGVSFGSVLSDAEQDLRAQGLPEPEVRSRAYREAVTSALTTGLLTSVFNRFAPGLESFGKMPAVKTVKEVLKKLMGGFGAEASEEGLDGLAQGIQEKIQRNPDKPWGEIVKESLSQAMAGGIVTVPMRAAAMASARRELPANTEQQLAEALGPELEAEAERAILPGIAPESVSQPAPSPESPTALGDTVGPEAEAEAELLPEPEPQPLPEQPDLAQLQRGAEPGPDLQVKLVDPPSGQELGLLPVASRLMRIPVDKIRIAIGKFLTKEGNLPEEAFRAWEQRTGEFNAFMQDAKFLVRDFYAGLRETYDVSRIQEIGGAFSRIPVQDVLSVNEALAGQRPISDLPTPLQAPVKAWRNRVDDFSSRMIAEGLVSGKLAMILENNLGTYLARSYKIFQDPKWAEQIPAELANRAKAFILSNLRATEAGAGATEADAERIYLNMLEDFRKHGVGAMFRSGQLGSKDLSLFMHRKDIAPEIRAVMGEIKDPVANFALSVSRMARFIADQHFLNDVREMGMGKWLFTEDDARPGFNTMIAADGSEVMAPLNGLRTSRAIAEAFASFQKSNPHGLFWRSYFWLNVASKSTKTVYSLMTQVRNAFGQLFFWMKSGHWDIRNTGEAARAVATRIGGLNDAGARQELLRYVRLRLIGDTTQANELRDMFRDAGLQDIDPMHLANWSLGQAIKKVAIKGPIEAYRLSDEFGKIVGFENERARLKRFHGDTKSDEELNWEASDRVRNEYPSYSRVPELVRRFRQIPFLGTFATFHYEAFRTMYHSLNYMAQDYSKGDISAGNQRLVGLMGAVASLYALEKLGEAMFGFTVRELRDLRRFLPFWDRDARKLIVDKKPGSIDYINLSYSNPYAYIMDTAMRVAAGARDSDSISTSVAQGLAQALRPFTDEQILFGSIMDIQRNQTSDGRQLYNPQLPDDDKARIKLWHVISAALEPGTLARLRKRGITTESVFSELFGFRRVEFSYRKAMGFKARDFRNADSDAERIFHTAVNQPAVKEPRNLLDAYRTADTQRFVLWQEMHRDIRAAIRSGGMDEGQIFSILTENGVGKDDAKGLIFGRYLPMKLSKATSAKAMGLGKQLPVNDIAGIISERAGKILEDLE